MAQTTRGKLLRVTMTTPLFGDVKSTVHAVVRKVVGDYASKIKNHMAAGMKAPKHGLMHMRDNGRIHIASAAGEPPAVDSGRLLASLQERFSMGGMVAKVGSYGVKYAVELEEGIDMDARPFAAPAAARYGTEFVETLRKAVYAAIKST